MKIRKHLWLTMQVTLNLLLVIAIAPFACADTTPTPEQIAFFESKVRPVLATACFGCHGSNDQRAGLRFDTKEHFFKGNAKGSIVEPGNPDKSRIIQALRYDGKVKMPPAGKLRDVEIAAITEWVKMGAPWTTAKSNAPKTPDFPIEAKHRNFWSFRKKTTPQVPKVKNTTWVKNPIDSFILAKLEAKNLKPATAADRRTLIRRVSFDLIGLPPTAEEVEAFVADKSPNAWEKVIDRLLASPHYGERWGRHWLDVVRYADSNGLDENVAFANAYRYRDYVVSSFNTDKPYNRFITEQLAGDLLDLPEGASRNEAITATGFLTLGPKLLAEPDKDKMVMDIVDEQIEVTTKTFMGLTVSCARCHHHKFDPISTEDYYALAGIFKSTKSMRTLNTVAMWHERPLASAEIEKDKAEFDTKIKAVDTELKQAKKTADQALLSGFRKDAEKYLLAGWILSQQGGTISVGNTLTDTKDASRIVIEAENFQRGNLNRDKDNYGKGIGVINNTNLPDEAEWDFEVPSDGLYQFEARYASQEARPVRFLLNGKQIHKEAAGSVTGGFFAQHQRWEVIGVFPFKAGKNLLRLESDVPIPHFDKFLIVPARQRNTNVPQRSAEQLAQEHGLNPAVLKQVSSLVASLPTNPTSLPKEELQAKIAELRPKIKLPEKQEQYYTEETKKSVAEIDKRLKDLREKAPKPVMVMAVEDGQIENTRVHLRGDTQTLGEVVPRRFLTVLNGDSINAGDEKRSGRLELAKWITDSRNPLTARVQVNRIWQGHFGEGLVRTPDNWGFLGLKPSHPELLDWLALKFVEQGWSIKKMHKLILTSNTYKMGTKVDAKTEQLASRIDTENTLLWKMQRRRLEAEPFRDSLLFVSGKLDNSMGGTLLSTPNHGYVTNDQSGNAARYNSLRRSIYLPIIRNALFDMFLAFDVGDPSIVNAKRATTTVAPQALYVMNSPFVVDQAKAFAQSLLAKNNITDTERIQQAYLRVYSRPATPVELARNQAYIKTYTERLPAAVSDSAKRRELAWASFCHLLYASNEFIYVN